MRSGNWMVILTAGAVLVGCKDRTPPVPRVPASSLEQPALVHQHDPPRPLRPPVDPNQGQLYDDVPLVDQRPPEQPEFIDAYNKIGRPRIVLFVNRTLNGQPAPPRLGNPPVGHEVAPPPGVYEPYLRPGEYDEAFARAIDYQAIETIMTDWLSAGGQTLLISPTAARGQLTAEQAGALETGDTAALNDLLAKANADVLVQVRIHPTRQTPQGLELRAVAEAINVRDGQSIARAVVDIPPPLQKTTINKYTRFLARKLMEGMIQSWTGFLRNAPPEARPPQPDSAPPVVVPQPKLRSGAGTPQD